MRLRGKYLCWLFVMMVFCAVVSCGCGGGSSGGSGSSSEDVTVPDSRDIPAPDTTPPESNDNPAPAPDTTVSPGEPANVPDDTSSSFWPDVSGTWTVESATFEDLGGSYKATLIHSVPSTFQMTIQNDDPYTLGENIVFSGEGVSNSGESYSSIELRFRAVVGVDGRPIEDGTGSEMMQSIGALLQHIFEYVGDNTYKVSDTYFDNAHASLTVTFPDTSTILYDFISTSRYELKATLKRVN